jgi:DNA primase large subunit
MDALHARYPFFDAARGAARELDASIPELAAEDAPAVERALERVERALVEGTTAPRDPGRWTPRDELLSYPVARILVSLLDDPKAIDKYAGAEAATAAERFAADEASDADELRSTTSVSVSLDEVLREFELDAAIRPEASEQTPRSLQQFRVSVGRYLALSDADWGDEWRLVNRELAAGEVRTRREELYGEDGEGLLVEAVRRRVAEGLPFDLDEESETMLRDSLDDELDDLRDLLGERTEVGQIDAVLPDLFPPCIAAIVEKAATDELGPVESFSLLSFLAAIGLDADETIVFCQETTLSPEQIRYQVDRLGDERGAQYPPPSCKTLEAHGICTDQDGHREHADHPLEYYRLRVASTPPEERTDWRERIQAD